MGLRVWSGGEIFGKKIKNTLGGVAPVYQSVHQKLTVHWTPKIIDSHRGSRHRDHRHLLNPSLYNYLLSESNRLLGLLEIIEIKSLPHESRLRDHRHLLNPPLYTYTIYQSPTVYWNPLRF